MACNPRNTSLALGCDDGAIRILSLLDGELENVRKFDGVKTRLLSIAWGPMSLVKKVNKGKGRETMDVDDSAEDSNTNNEYEDSMIVTGCADSTVRIWDARSGRCVHRMTTDKMRGEQTLVWAIVFLQDGTIVSGDSMGLVKFWDGKMGTQLQSIKSHKADVLTITIGPDGKTIYSSGVDQKVSQIRYVPVESMDGKEQKTQDHARWVLSLQRRLHSHDVRTLAVSPSYSLSSCSSRPFPSSPPVKVPIVISGGLDFSLVYTPASTSSETSTLANPISDSDSTTFQESFNRKGSFIPQRSGPINFAREGKLLVCRRERGIDVWKLKGENSKREKAWEKVLEMEFKVCWLI